jgi:hypothetical protein
LITSKKRITMDKHLLGLVWDLPTSFALPSVAACRRALVHIRPRLMQLPPADDARRGSRSRLDPRF